MCSQGGGLRALGRAGKAERADRTGGAGARVARPWGRVAAFLEVGAGRCWRGACLSALGPPLPGVPLKLVPLARLACVQRCGVPASPAFSCAEPCRTVLHRAIPPCAGRCLVPIFSHVKEVRAEASQGSQSDDVLVPFMCYPQVGGRRAVL